MGICHTGEQMLIRSGSKLSSRLLAAVALAGLIVVAVYGDIKSARTNSGVVTSSTIDGFSPGAPQGAGDRAESVAPDAGLRSA